MRLLNALAALVIAACAVVAYVVLSSPDPPPPSAHGTDAHHAPPFEPFANAHVGDWRASRIVNDGTLVRDSKVGAITAHATHAITAVGDATLVIATRGIIDTPPGLQDPAGPSPPLELPRHGATFEQLIASDWRIPSFSVEDDTRTIGGRAFHCKKVTYRQIDPMLPRKSVDVELWLSPEVAVDGFVARHEVQVLDKLAFTMDEELVGYGTGSAIAWGTRPSDL